MRTVSETANTTTPPTGGRLVRLARPSIVGLCGPAGCGKSTFAAKHFRSGQIVSSDKCRELVSDDERDQRYSEQAFALLHYIVEKRVSINRLSVIDSTALREAARRSLLSLARRYQVPCVLFLFHVPLEKCLARDQNRERSVGAPVVEEQVQLFEETCRGVHQEGFDHVVEFRDEEMDGVRIEVVFRPVKRPQVRTQARPGSVRNSRTDRRRPSGRPESRAEAPAPPASPPDVSSPPDASSPNERAAPESSEAPAAAQETPQDEAGT